MSENLKAIKEQIGSVANLKKITRAMEMVARSKMKRAVDSAIATRPYAEHALDLLSDLTGSPEEHSHFLLTEGEGAKDLVIHIASEKGLCGGYNAQALRSLEGFMRERKSEEVDFISVGRYAIKHAERIGAFHLQHYTVGENIELSEAHQIAQFIIERFEGGAYRSVYISYTNFKTVFSQQNLIQQLLPITKSAVMEMIQKAGDEDTVGTEDRPQLATIFGDRYRFEPSKELVLETLLPGLVTTNVYQALLEANASEQSSRMVAMKSATDNATKFGEELTLRYNRARQANITREIIEIAAGADAV